MDRATLYLSLRFTSALVKRRSTLMAKSFFRIFMALGTYLYKISNGKIGGRISGLEVLLLTTTGRKTGKERTTPLGYFRDKEGSYIIIGSNAGFDTHPAWFHNLKRQPHVNIQV